MRFLKKNRSLRASLVLIAFAAAIFLPAASQDDVLAAENELAAVMRNGALEVSIPYEAAVARSRIMNIELLDPNDKPVAKLARPIYPSSDTASWKVVIPLEKRMTVEELAWNRLKIKAGDISKVVSISEILRLPVARIFAQRSYAAGSSASVRIIAVDSKSSSPLRNSSIRLELVNGDQSKTLFTGRTDSFGTAQVAFALPAGEFGPRRLRATLNTALGTVVADQPVQIDRRDRILLTTDKPLYQPGQTIHLRALAFDGPTRAAAAQQTITLEVEDARGNKVFKKRARTDRFGIASADFELADEVNFGPYHVRAILGDTDAQTTQEKTITVDRYALPKFKIEIELTKDEAKKQAGYYSPGETVSGKVTARYLFGKPLVNANVSVTLASFDVQAIEIGRLNGKTDSEGRFSFSSKLPDFFAGRSTEQGSAPVSIGVEVKDTADHTETKTRDILVSNRPILIMAVPESGRLLPGLENRVYILTSYPDGTPAKTVVTGNIARGRVETDASGVATISIRPDKNPVVLSLKATDDRGQSAQADVRIESLAQPQSLMLRTSKAVYKAGERLRLETFSTRQRGAVYIDVVKNGQTLITRAIETSGGRGVLSIDLTPSMFGAIEVRAYQITSEADPVSDRRLVYIDPADDLKVSVTAERESYRPGEDACINFTVTDHTGRPVSAALGIEIVDEAVFALSEKHPGFEKVFMYLEKELLTPRYEVHQFSIEEVLLDDVPAQANERERAAQVLLAAAGTVGDRDVRAEFGREAIEARRSEYHARYLQRIAEKAQALAKAMTVYYSRHAASAEGFNRDLQLFASENGGHKALLEDPWGSTLAGEGTINRSGYSYLMLRSAGPDQREKTLDDLIVQVYAERARKGAGVKLTVYPVYPADKEGMLNAEVRRFGERAKMARGDALALAQGMPGAATVAEDEAQEKSGRKAASNESDDQNGGPRVRSFFPETLYTNAALITDGQGRASIRVPVADSITTWRVTSLASTARGALGSSTYPIRVFQDFFVDLDLPVSITEGDTVSVPVAVYNYLPTAGRVRLELRQDPWFTLEGDAATKQVEVGSGKVTVAYFRVRASKIGEQQLQVTARLEGGKAQSGDAVARAVNVLPNGEERAVVINERLEGAATREVVIPEGAIADASKIFVKFYPGALSQVVEGLDSILQMPNGCFEQTSSSTYPNVLVLDYLKTSKKLTPEIQAKAEGFISLGYQRLVTFEVNGGGFSWFGQAPANKILTAYGLMEFSDMSRVHEVDPRLIERTQSWLASQQQPDGSFKPDTSFINEGATNRYNNDILRITAYIGWALAATGYSGDAVEKAKQYVTSRATGKEDAYTLAVIANFAADHGKDKAWVASAISSLAARAIESDRTAYWKQEGETPTSARNDSADLETTALAVQALLKSGQRSGLAKKALDYLTEKKDAFGNWQTTQATILSLKAFLLSFTKGTNADTAGTIEVSVDGEPAGRIEITRENNDLLHLVDLKAHTHRGAHRVGLSFTGKGSMQYQIVGRYYVPWARRADGPREPLSIEVSYDRTRLAQDETATARVRVQNNTGAAAKMVMLDLGIPPGFEIAREDFEAMIERTRGKSGGKLEKFTITAKQAILYFDGLNARQRVEFSFKLRAKFPVRAQTFSSRIYEYYNPKVEDKTRPVEMTVVAKQ